MVVWMSLAANAGGGHQGDPLRRGCHLLRPVGSTEPDECLSLHSAGCESHRHRFGGCPAGTRLQVWEKLAGEGNRSVAGSCDGGSLEGLEEKIQAILGGGRTVVVKQS